MIIKDKDYLAGTTYDGDEFTMHHVQPTLSIKEEAHDMRVHGNNGWTKDKNFRHIAHIPALDAAMLEKKMPGIFDPQDKSIMNGWLKTTKGEDYLLVKKDSI